MRLFRLRPVELRHLAETALIALAGGSAAELAGMPVGFLSGSLLFVAVAALAGRPMFLPNGLARVVFVLMGTSIGSVVTPQTLHGMGTWPLSIAILAVAMLCIMAATASYLHFAHGLDALSALFAASPGALSQVMVLSLESGADLRAIVVVQTMRVFILTLGLPVMLEFFGFNGARLVLPGGPTAGEAIPEFLVLIVASALVAFLFLRLRVPGGLIFGAMLPSAILHGTGLVHVRLPLWAVASLMVSLGAISGSRFANADRQQLLRLLGAALGSCAVAFGVTLLCAVTVAALLSLRVPDLVVAYAPGSLDAMMLLALALGLDPVFVGAHHIGRLLLVSLCLPFFVRFYGDSTRHLSRIGERSEAVRSTDSG